MRKIILIYLPYANGQFREAGLELVEKARELTDGLDWEIRAAALLPGEGAPAAPLPSISKLYLYKNTSIYDVNNSAAVLTALCEEIRPEIFLIGATAEGRAMAPLIAASLTTGLTADCTKLYFDETEELVQVRPAFEETLRASIKTRTRPIMATARPGAMILNESRESTEIPELIAREFPYINSLTQLSVDRIPRTGIRSCKILVASGGGIQNKEDLEPLGAFARSLGGELASSRKLVERGWMPRERQIGLSGFSTKAELLITIGVSGSAQFQAGIHGVKKLIAVNNEDTAPILALADYPVLMDLNELIRFLRKESFDERNIQAS